MTARLAELGVTDRGRALASPPTTRRTWWLAIVPRCPHCSGMHHHRHPDGRALLAGLVDRRCPVTGAEYTLRPVRPTLHPRRSTAVQWRRHPSPTAVAGCTP